jgi:hypothetical protein
MIYQSRTAQEKATWQFSAQPYRRRLDVRGSTRRPVASTFSARREHALVVAIGDNVAVAERIAALHNLTEAAPTMLAVIEPRYAARTGSGTRAIGGARSPLCDQRR